MQFTDLGMTEAKMGEEIIYNKIFLLDYFFEKEQLLKIQIFSPEDPNIKFSLDCTVGRIMGSKNLSYSHQFFSEGQEYGNKLSLIIDAKNAKESKELIKLKISLNFDPNKLHPLRKYDLVEVFYSINNFIDGKNYRSIYKSEEKENINGYFLFEELLISKDQLCENDSDQILIRFYDSKYIEFAYTKTCLKEIRMKNALNGSNEFCEVFEKESNQSIGRINYSFKQQLNKTFVDYLSNNLQINLIIGIDFTASNGKSFF